RCPRGHGLGLSLEDEGLERPVLDRLLRLAIGGLTHDHVAWLTRRLKAGGDIHGVTDDRVTVADRAGDDLARVHADAQRKADLMRGAELLVDLGHRFLHTKPCSDGPLGVVLVGDRSTEERHYVVADVFVHRAAVALDLLPQPAETEVNEALQRLGIHLLGNRRVAGEVREENRYAPPLFRRGCLFRSRRGSGRRSAGLERRATG